MTIKLKNSLNELKQLVTNFEENELELTSVPEKLINEYGYACLANTLMFKEPKIPPHDEEKISEYFKKNKFNTLDSLINYIKSIKDDINKLFAIFSWTALNIQFDTELYFSGKHKTPSLEDVFNTKRAVCDGYTLFVREMAKLVGINTKKITIKEYSNIAKGYSYNALNPPKEDKSNHFSVFVEIDGVPFISEPTWAAGHINDNKQFEWEYNPKLFLIPLYNTLCEYFPIEESQKLLPFKFSYDDFLKSCRVEPFDRYLKAEGVPFINFESKNGYLEQFYSCTGPIDYVNYKIFVKKKNSFNKIESDAISSYEIITPKLPKHPERCRFRTCISLPNKGFYLIKMFIDGPQAIEYYVNCLKKSTISVPVKCNLFHESKFIPIIPKTILTQVENGYALIRFAVKPKRSSLLWDITKLAKQNSLENKGETISREFGRYITLKLPFDEERYEDQLCVTFPSNGRYCVLIYLANDIGSYTTYTQYFFDVTGVTSDNPQPINPTSFMYKGRIFAPRRIFDGNDNEVIIKPNQNCYIVDKKEQSLLIKTASIDDKIHLEFKQEDKTLIFVKQDGQDGQFRRYSWTIPDELGEYHMKGWINNKYSMDLTYIYNKDELKEETQEEKDLLAELKSKTDLDESALEKKRKEEEKRILEEEKRKQQQEEENKKKQEEQTAEVAKKKESKCCLLI